MTFITCEEEFDDRFADYAEDEEPKNHERDYDSEWYEPMSLDEYMQGRL